MTSCPPVTLATALSGGDRCCSYFTNEVTQEWPRQDCSRTHTLVHPALWAGGSSVQGSHASYSAGVDTRYRKESTPPSPKGTNPSYTVEGSGVSCSGVGPMPSLGLAFLSWTRSDDSVVMVSTAEHAVRGRHCAEWQAHIVSLSPRRKALILDHNPWDRCHVTLPSVSGFLHASSLDVLGRITLCCGACFVYCRIPGL